MLVLTRYRGQAIKIGDNVEMVVLGLQNGRVQLGFRAPESVKILRTELVSNDGVGEGQQVDSKGETPEGCSQDNQIDTEACTGAA